MYWTQIQVKLSFDSFKDPKDQSCVLAVLFNQIHFEVNPENTSDCQSQIVGKQQCSQWTSPTYHHLLKQTCPLTCVSEDSRVVERSS